MWSVEETTSTRTRVVAARGVEVVEQLLEHRGVDRVAGLGAVEPQQRDALLVDVVGASARHQSIASPSGSASSVGDLARRGARSRRRRARSARGPRRRARRSGRARRRRRSRGRSSRGARRRPGRARSRGRRARWARLLSPLWPATPPPSFERTSPNGRSISSWSATTISSGTLSAPRAGPADVAGLVHEGLRQQHRDARAARAGAALGDQAAEVLLRLRQVPAARELGGDLEADVVAGRRVAAPGLPSPTIRTRPALAGLRPRPRPRRGGAGRSSDRGYSPSSESPESPAASPSAGSSPSPAPPRPRAPRPPRRPARPPPRPRARAPPRPAAARGWRS